MPHHNFAGRASCELGLLFWFGEREYVSFGSDMSAHMVVAFNFHHVSCATYQQHVATDDDHTNH